MSDPPDPSDIILGTARKPYPHPQFRLSKEEQSYHGLIWGSTGTGKSKFLQSLFLQHINKGNGVGLIDPHGDLSLGCLSHLVGQGFFKEPNAYDRLVYIEFGGDAAIPFNVLNTPHPPHTRAHNTLEALTRTWPELNNAPLFRVNFLASATALISNNLPITEMNRILLDDEFRKECLSAVDDPLVQQYFASYAKQGKGQAGSAIRRAFLLSFSPVSRNSLGQRGNVLEFRKLMDAGTSVIVNLGSITDPIIRRLFGSLIMVQIEQAALSRSNILPQQRTPWTCLVDEWPSIAAAQGGTLENVLTQARKYNLRLYLAAQSLAQVDSSRLAGALEQCRASVTFRLGNDSARMQAKNIATILPRDEETPSRSEQMQMWFQSLKELPPRDAFVKIHGQRLATRIRTLNVPDLAIHPKDLEKVRNRYRDLYHVPVQETGPLEHLDPAAIDMPEILSVEEMLRGTRSPLENFETFFGEANRDEADA